MAAAPHQLNAALALDQADHRVQDRQQDQRRQTPWAVVGTAEGHLEEVSLTARRSTILAADLPAHRVDRPTTVETTRYLPKAVEKSGEAMGWRCAEYNYAAPSDHDLLCSVDPGRPDSEIGRDDPSLLN